MQDIQQLKQQLLELLKEKSFQKKKVILSSGKESNYYLDARVTTLSAEGAYLIGKIIFSMIKNDDVSAVGGMTMGADPMVGAIVFASYQEGKPIPGFIIRKNPKSYGLQRLIEGPPLKPGSKVVIVDDVVTTGGSLVKSIKAVREAGCEVSRVIAIIDREEGTAQALSSLGCSLSIESIFTAKDFGV